MRVSILNHADCLDGLGADLDNLPEPDELVQEIVDNLEAGLASFRAIAAALA